MINLDKYQNEQEFQTALKEMFSSLDESVINNPRYKDVLNKIIEPDNIITFDVKWLDDNNVKHTNKGYRVQFNNVNGVYKGGLRFHPSVNLSILKFWGFLARLQQIPSLQVLNYHTEFENLLAA